MSTFQIAVSVCLLTFFLVTGCNDLTSSNNQSLNSQIVKEVQDADAQMAAKQAKPEGDGSTTTVEIMQQENRDAEAQNAAAVEDSTSVDKLAKAEKQDSKNTQDEAGMQTTGDSGSDSTVAK